MKAILKNARISPKKVNIVAGLIRKVNAEEALAMLKFSNKKASEVLYKLLASAVANAENNFKQNAKDLVVEEVKVSKGQTMKRFQPISRGRAHPIRKVNSHITIILKAEVQEKPKATKPKAEPKKAEKAAA